MRSEPAAPKRTSCRVCKRFSRKEVCRHCRRNFPRKVKKDVARVTDFVDSFEPTLDSSYTIRV